MPYRETFDIKEEDSRRVSQGAIAVLSTGWKISFALIILGLVVALIRDEPLTNELGSFRNVLADLGKGRANGFLGIGILAMIISPIAATLTIMTGFFRIGDRRYAFISLGVLVILITSIVIASF